VDDRTATEEVRHGSVNHAGSQDLGLANLLLLANKEVEDVLRHARIRIEETAKLWVVYNEAKPANTMLPRRIGPNEDRWAGKVREDYLTVRHVVQ
jgi:hypothetical protein